MPFGRYRDPRICDPDELRAAARALAGTTIHHGDFTTATRELGAGDFVYFDPPYVPVSKTADFTSYAAGGFGARIRRGSSPRSNACAARARASCSPTRTRRKRVHSTRASARLGPSAAADQLGQEQAWARARARRRRGTVMDEEARLAIVARAKAELRKRLRALRHTTPASALAKRSERIVERSPARCDRERAAHRALLAHRGASRSRPSRARRVAPRARRRDRVSARGRTREMTFRFATPDELVEDPLGFRGAPLSAREASRARRDRRARDRARRHRATASATARASTTARSSASRPTDENRRRLRLSSSSPRSRRAPKDVAVDSSSPTRA